MNLKPQDVLVVLKLVAIGNVEWAYNKLAVELSLSPSQVHSSIKRALKAGLLNKRHDEIHPNYQNLQEFLLHGLKYVFVVEKGAMSQGIPTAYAAEPLKQKLILDNEPIPVWPHPDGKSRGIAFSPLHKAAPQAALNDAKLYELLVIVDALRSGRARERSIAAAELKKRLKPHA